jgi:hypothetical protein
MKLQEIIEVVNGKLDLSVQSEKICHLLNWSWVC